MIDFEVSPGFHSPCGVHQRRRVTATCGICGAREATERREREMARSDVTVRRVDSAAQVSRNAKHYAHDGLSLTLRQWSEQPSVKALGIHHATLKSRLDKGWSIAMAVTTPREKVYRKRVPA